MATKRRLYQDWILSNQFVTNRGNTTTIYFTAINRQKKNPIDVPLSTVRLGEMLQLYRMKAFWTLDDVVQRLDDIIDREQLRMFERGSQIPCTFVLQKLQDVFKTDFSQCRV